MIPKTIHYCWFGNGKFPKLAQKCLESWKKFCPDYEIICWNEEKFDLNINTYVKEAYENKKYAFVTDYVRLYVLYNYGGIYMDTDVEVLKSLDEFLQHKAFSGFENETDIPTGIMGSEKGVKIFKELLNYYESIHFKKKDGTLDITSNVTTITNIMKNKGLKQNNELQTVEEFTLYPKEYFCPIDYPTKTKTITENTYTIHWFSGSWVSNKDKAKIRTYNILVKIFGQNTINKILVKKRK